MPAAPDAPAHSSFSVSPLGLFSVPSCNHLTAWPTQDHHLVIAAKNRMLKGFHILSGFQISGHTKFAHLNACCRVKSYCVTFFSGSQPAGLNVFEYKFLLIYMTTPLKFHVIVPIKSCSPVHCNNKKDIDAAVFSG